MLEGGGLGRQRLSKFPITGIKRPFHHQRFGGVPVATHPPQPIHPHPGSLVKNRRTISNPSANPAWAIADNSSENAICAVGSSR